MAAMRQIDARPACEQKRELNRETCAKGERGQPRVWVCAEPAAEPRERSCQEGNGKTEDAKGDQSDSERGIFTVANVNRHAE